MTCEYHKTIEIISIFEIATSEKYLVNSQPCNHFFNMKGPLKAI